MRFRGFVAIWSNYGNCPRYGLVFSNIFRLVLEFYGDNLVTISRKCIAIVWQLAINVVVCRNLVEGQGSCFTGVAIEVLMSNFRVAIHVANSHSLLVGSVRNGNCFIIAIWSNCFLVNRAASCVSLNFRNRYSRELIASFIPLTVSYSAVNFVNCCTPSERCRLGLRTHASVRIFDDNRTGNCLVQIIFGYAGWIILVRIIWQLVSWSLRIIWSNSYSCVNQMDYIFLVFICRELISCWQVLASCQLVASWKGQACINCLICRASLLDIGTYLNPIFIVVHKLEDYLLRIGHVINVEVLAFWERIHWLAAPVNINTISMLSLIIRNVDWAVSAGQTAFIQVDSVAIWCQIIFASPQSSISYIRLVNNCAKLEVITGHLIKVLQIVTAT